jgi:hypothetical protein
MNMDCMDGKFYTFCISAVFGGYFADLLSGHFNTIAYFDASTSFYRHDDENAPITILIPTVFSLILTNFH